MAAAERVRDLRLVANQVAPLALARERTLPLLPALTSLFPEGGLRRGSIVAVGGVGATSLALAVAAGPSASGSWTAVVGDPGLGLAAAAEAGVVLERMLVVDPKGQDVAGVIAALVGSVDVVLVGPGVRIRPADVRRLTARMRERGSALVRIGALDEPGVDIGLRIVESEWTGLGAGHGLLRARRVRVETQGRGSAARPRGAALLLPGPQGAPVVLGEPALDEPAAGESEVRPALRVLA
ncbi:MAG: hypothetical protein R2707_08980 [Acidimicrobiales bacterium]